MLNNVALDVAIGLVFVYLLYSLLATILAELIATKLGLRARNLKEAVDRMLNDEKEKGFWGKLWDSLRLMKNPKNAVVKNFYDHPEIKYLGSSGLFSAPSQFKAVSFSKTLLYLLNGPGQLNSEQIKEQLEKKAPLVLGASTSDYVLNLYREANGDIAKFKMQLETWFDRTMEQATEWYKRKIQIVLLILSFMIAWLFNVDTFAIVRKLSDDKDARDKMVTLASAYVQNNPRPAGLKLDSTARYDSSKIDSLLEVKAKLEEDIDEARGLLGTGSLLPDSVRVVRVADARHAAIYLPAIEYSLINNFASLKPNERSYIDLSHSSQWGYLFGMFYRHFWGFLVTALALSLGAPFWFDMLNKLMKLRTSIKQSAETTNTLPDNTVRTAETKTDDKVGNE